VETIRRVIVQFRPAPLSHLQNSSLDGSADLTQLEALIVSMRLTFMNNFLTGSSSDGGGEEAEAKSEGESKRNDIDSERVQEVSTKCVKSGNLKFKHPSDSSWQTRCVSAVLLTCQIPLSFDMHG
jgi:hypothetical protein